ncbi:type II secretion system protein N [Sulfitobacter sp. D35]|uniref:type II secretion system protein N n=1 Tax=Sulfitobacter sp. D35 TaxID=3083252 RepID=UPI00296EB878|nr:type II secretion system protein N [Sulfitobacter sp. D35]MDW4500482.1 type II secretion system protein N [Sulfitobacter sp. D35]
MTTILVACVACALAAMHLVQAIRAPDVSNAVAGRDSTDTVLERRVEGGDRRQAGSGQPFLPVFGVPTSPKPVVDAQRPMPEKPRFDYRLKGVVASDLMRWAILSGEGGDLLVREGDKVDGAARIAKIYAEGVDVVLAGETLNITFSETDRVDIAAFEAKPQARSNPRTAPRPKTQEIVYQNMSPDEILAVLSRAEEERQARGWVPRAE